MIRLLPYIILLIISCALDSIAQKLESSGKIENKGTIKVKGSAISTADTAKIENNGTIIFEGHTWISQDTLSGRVEFNRDDSAPLQIVPQMYYNSVYFHGSTKKSLDTNTGNPFVAIDTLNTAPEVKLEIQPMHDIFARGRVTHYGTVNPGYLFGRVTLDGINAQGLDGTGQYKELELYNLAGADVMNSGGFRIRTALELMLGEMRNDSFNNFIMEDSSLIVRNVGGSIRTEPKFEKRVSVKYIGDGSMVSGGELPNDTSSLQGMYVENTGGITLSKDVTVNKELVLKSTIRTEEDSLKKHTLTYSNASDPVFANVEAEIDGSIKRTQLRFDGNKNIFNNPYTYSTFPDSISGNYISEMTFRVKPRTAPPFYKGDQKVIRFISISALDKNLNPIKTGFNAQIGYGWRHSPGNVKDETNNLPVEDLILQRWTGSEWFDIENSMKPVIDTLNEWAFSFATSVATLGDFAIGMPGGTQLVLNSRVLLEGPWRFGSMAMDLRLKNLVPTTPPDIYPYNLDPNRPFISVNSIPDSVVDWIVIEFRANFNSSDRYYRTVFVRTDGKIVDLDGKSPVLLSKGGIDSGEYYIAVRHRNHLAIITENRIRIYPETIQNIIDFTSPDILMGRTNALEPLGFDPNGSVLFGMIAGDVNGDGIINQEDVVKAWNERDYEGYFSTDNNMSGLINTRDMNYSWNNRGRVSNVP